MIRIGPAGWSYPDWEGIVYPRGTKDKLQFIARFVDMIEVNSTFYRPPDRRTAASWAERTAFRPGFFQAEFNAGQAHFKKKQLEPARAAFERALRSRPTSPEAHFQLGLVLAQGGELDAADRELRRALELEPALGELAPYREARARLDRLLHGR